MHFASEGSHKDKCAKKKKVCVHLCVRLLYHLRLACLCIMKVK